MQLGVIQTSLQANLRTELRHKKITLARLTRSKKLNEEHTICGPYNIEYTVLLYTTYRM